MGIPSDCYNCNNCYNNYKLLLIGIVNLSMCFKQKFRRICEIINIVHSRGMLYFAIILMYCIICFSFMESNKKSLKNKKRVCVCVCVCVCACVYVCVCVCVCVCPC